MRENQRKKRLLSVYCYLFGLANIATATAIPLLFGDELLWQPRNLPTDLMVGALYLAMGIVMVAIARSAHRYKAFIDFIIISSVLHAVVMVAYAQKPSHIYLDAVFIGLMGLIPLILYPWPRRTMLRYGIDPES